MNKKYLLAFLVLVVIASTAISAEAFSFRNLLEKFRLGRASNKAMVRASSTSPWIRGGNRSATSTMPFFGTVISVNDTTLTVKLDLPNSIPGMMKFRASTTKPWPESLIINLNSETVYASGTKSSLLAGVKVNGQAKINPDGSLTATRIHINPPRNGVNRPEDNRFPRGPANKKSDQKPRN